jgi:hypothetical protein
MFNFLAKALEWLKSPKRWAALLIVCAVLLLLPAPMMQKLGLVEIRERYLSWISLSGILSLAVLAVEFADWLRERIKLLLKQKKQKAVLCALTPPEVQIIADYFTKETDAQYLSSTDGLAGGLSLKGLIYRSANITTNPPMFAYNLQPWVRETIRKNPAILQKFTVILNQKTKSKA